MASHGQRACSSVGESARLISVRSEVQIFPGPPCVMCACLVASDGAVAQLGERGLCKPEVVGSNPISSTIARNERWAFGNTARAQSSSNRIDLRDGSRWNRKTPTLFRVTRPHTGRVRTAGPSDRSLTVESLSGSKRSMRLVHASVLGRPGFPVAREPFVTAFLVKLVRANGGCLGARRR